MGDFIADAFRQATGADIGLVNGGSIRADATIQPGVLTKRDVLSILPYNNKVVKMQLTGAVIRAALEHGVASIGQETQPGRFPQVSGLRYAYDASRKPGARITSITVNGKPLDDKRTYTLATTTYVALEAGDGYDMFRNAPLLIRPEQAPSETDILQKAIASVPAIAPKIDGRIKRVDVGKDQSTCN
jgi:5'-nucleotidase